MSFLDYATKHTTVLNASNSTMYSLYTTQIIFIQLRLHINYQTWKRELPRSYK